MYRNFLFILTLHYSGPGILLDIFHSVSYCFKFGSSFLFFSFPDWMFQEPMVWKVSGKIDRSIIIISIITVKCISKYHCQTESAVIFKAQWDTESHLHMSNLWLLWVKTQPALAISHYRAKHWREKEYNIKILVAADASV